MLVDLAAKGLAFLRQTASNLPVLALTLSLLAPGQYEADPVAACTSLRRITFSNLDVTALNSSYHVNASENGKSLCRVHFVITTSNVSAITVKAWLPAEWNERLLTLGNGGLGGNIDYRNLRYGSSLGFATIASNNGHDGDTGAPFANNSEVLADFTSRSIHLITVAGKVLAKAYYNRPPRRSYYMGCSTGGRQGIYAALHIPLDFDGVLAGAPATNFNYLLGWSGMITKYVGAPDGNESPSFISPQLWDIISEEMLSQCDGLDGVMDGIITEPDACYFKPEELKCKGRSIGECLSEAQIEALRQIYSPLYGRFGELLFPRFDPGAEASPGPRSFMFGGRPHPYEEDWMKYVVYDGKPFNYSRLNLDDIERSEAMDPGNISTFSGDFSAFHARGGKLITYHGRADALIPSGNSKALYDLAARTFESTSGSMDDFYRLFLVPGMDHCVGGKGAFRFGQHLSTSLLDLEGRYEGGMKQSPVEDKPSNIIASLVDWVEKGLAPEHIVGVSKDGNTTRRHCRYPMQSIWDRKQWICSN